MSAPLPLRFHNPVKDLCAKVNLDYETVIGTGLSSKMREAYVLADIPKELNDINAKDKIRVKNKLEALNRKYGDSCDGKERPSGETPEDKGRIRYDSELIVEHLHTNDRKMDEPNSIRYGLENTIPIQYTRAEMLWCPGKGVISGDSLGKL